MVQPAGNQIDRMQPDYTRMSSAPRCMHATLTRAAPFLDFMTSRRMQFPHTVSRSRDLKTLSFPGRLTILDLVDPESE